MTHTAPPDGLPPLRRYLAFAAVVTAIWSVVLDSMAIGVALPIMARDFGVTDAEVTWVIAINQLVIVSSLLVFSSLGEIFGYRRVYQIGLVLFMIATLACTLAPSLPVLIAARGVQALGAGCIMSMNFALVRFIFPASRLGSAVGLSAMMVALASCLGPTVAGAILSVASWQWIFAFTVPFAAASLLIGLFVLPHTPRSGDAFDGTSALLSAMTFGGLLVALTAGGHGWPPLAIGLIACAGFLAAIALYRRLRFSPAPLLPLDLLRLPVFALSITASICTFAAQMLAFVALPFLFHGPLALNELETGLAFSLWPLMLACTAPISGRLADKLPPGPMGFAGLAILATGLLALSQLSAGAGILDIGWRMALCGLGFGIFQSPNNRTMVASAPRHRAGAASGMVATARLVGQAIGTAIATFALANGNGGGPAMALAIAAGFAAIGAFASVSRGRSRAAG